MSLKLETKQELLFWARGGQIFSVKFQTVNLVGSVGRMDSVTTNEPFYYSMKAAIDNT